MKAPQCAVTYLDSFLNECTPRPRQMIGATVGLRADTTGVLHTVEGATEGGNDCTAPLHQVEGATFEVRVYTTGI